MEAMVKEWTDGRLDDLSKGIDRGFKQVDHRFDQVDHRFDRVEGEVKSGRQEMRNEFAAMRKEINGVHRAMVFGAIAMTGAILTGFAGICGLIATQL
jgi:hypothetical protein